MSSGSSSLLSIRNLFTRFHTMDGVINAVDGLDMDLFRDETLGLVGESGCGKSVTALSILRLLRCPPTVIAGNIEFKNRNLLELDLDGIRRIRGKTISMIFQEPMTSLNPVLTIGEQIAESVRLHEDMTSKEAWRWAEHMLQMVQIPSPKTIAKEYPHKLSGGMRQRAMIAMALACNPQLLIADEPTTALDVTIQAQIMNLMKELKDKFGTSIILITHDLGVIAEMVSRVIVMYAGKIVEQASVRDIFKDPLHPYTQGLLGSVPVIGQKTKKKIKTKSARRLREIPGIVPNLIEMPEGCRFNPRCSMIMEKCRREEPPIFDLGDKRKVRCWIRKG